MHFSRIFLTVLLAAFLVIGCRNNAQTDAGKPEDQLLRVTTAEVQNGEMVDTLHIYGRIAFRNETILSSQFEGRLSDLSLLIGDRVHKGEKIATVIPPQREALMQLSGKVPEETRHLLESEIKSIDLRSPLDGRVVEIWRHTGDVVQRGEKILHIGDPGILQILADIPVKLLTELSVNQKLQVSFPGIDLPPADVAVAAISPNIDPEKQAALLRLRLPNPKSIYRPGMMVKIQIPAQTHKQTLIVPRNAVLEEEGIFRVYVLNGNRVEERIVVPGITQANRIEITEGLAAGEKVVTEKVYSMVDGMEVQR